MNFQDIQEIFESKFGVTRLADIARELGVTPQVVSNWKARNQLPYKYVKKLEKIIEEKENSQDKRTFKEPITIIQGSTYEKDQIEHTFDFVSFINELIKIIRNNIIIFLTVPVLIAGTTAFYVKYVVQERFETTVKIIPSGQNGNAISGLSNISGALGMKSMGGGDLSSGIYYPDLVMSRSLHKRLLDQKFDTDKFGPNVPLLGILIGNGSKNLVKESSNRKIMLALKRLSKSLKLKTKRTNMLMTLHVTAMEPKLAFDISNQIVSKLNILLREFEEERLKQKIDFIDQRIKEETSNLAAFEDSLKEFRENNREIKRSPALRLEEERLMRETQVRTQVYITLKQQFEMAQIEKMENINFLHLIDTSGISIRRKSPDRVKSVLISFVFGIIVTFGGLFSRSHYSSIKDKLKG